MSWWIKWYRFKAYHSVTRHLCIVFTTSSQVSFQHHWGPPLPSSTSPFHQLYVYELLMFFFLIPAPFSASPAIKCLWLSLGFKVSMHDLAPYCLLSFISQKKKKSQIFTLDYSHLGHSQFYSSFPGQNIIPASFALAPILLCHWPMLPSPWKPLQGATIFLPPNNSRFCCCRSSSYFVYPIFYFRILGIFLISSIRFK